MSNYGGKIMNDYRRGLIDAWEFASKLAHLSTELNARIFGSEDPFAMSYDTAKAIYKKSTKFVVGDVITDGHGHNAVVTMVSNNGFVHFLTDDGVGGGIDPYSCMIYHYKIGHIENFETILAELKKSKF